MLATQLLELEKKYDRPDNDDSLSGSGSEPILFMTGANTKPPATRPIENGEIPPYLGAEGNADTSDDDDDEQFVDTLW